MCSSDLAAIYDIVSNDWIVVTKNPHTGKVASRIRVGAGAKVRGNVVVDQGLFAIGNDDSIATASTNLILSDMGSVSEIIHSPDSYFDAAAAAIRDVVAANEDVVIAATSV